MANIYGNKQYISTPAGYERLDRAPLEKNTVFENLAALNQYISTSTANGGTAYAGQILTTVEGNDIYKVYTGSSNSFTASGIIEKYMSQYTGSNPVPFNIYELHNGGDIYLGSVEQSTTGTIYQAVWSEEESDYVYIDLIEELTKKMQDQNLIYPVSRYNNTKYPDIYVNNEEIKTNIIYVVKNIDSSNKWDEYTEWIVSPEQSEFWDRNKDNKISVEDITEVIDLIRHADSDEQWWIDLQATWQDSIMGLAQGSYTEEEWIREMCRRPEILLEQFGEFTLNTNISEAETAIAHLQNDVSTLRGDVDELMQGGGTTPSTGIEFLEYNYSILRIDNIIEQIEQSDLEYFSLQNWITDNSSARSWTNWLNIFFTPGLSSDYMPNPKLQSNLMRFTTGSNGYIVPNIKIVMGNQVVSSNSNNCYTVQLEWIYNENYYKLLFTTDNSVSATSPFPAIAYKKFLGQHIIIPLKLDGTGELDIPEDINVIHQIYSSSRLGYLVENLTNYKNIRLSKWITQGKSPIEIIPTVYRDYPPEGIIYEDPDDPYSNAYDIIYNFEFIYNGIFYDVEILIWNESWNGTTWTTSAIRTISKSPLNSNELNPINLD